MKRNQLTKIFLTVLCATLLVCAIAGIQSFAADTETNTYDIKAINVIHDEKSIVLIAVDLPSATELTEAPDVEVSYTFDGETLDAKFHSYLYIEKYGNYYPCYYTVGIAPVDIAEEIVAVAYKTGAEPDMAKADSISLAEYLYTRLYRDDVISATEGDDLDRRGMYLALLEYGSYAQNVFHNNKAENAEDQRTLANELIYVYSAEATVNGTHTLLLDKSADVTLAGAAVAPAEYKQSGWQVKKYDGAGNLIATETVVGSTYTATTTSVVVPMYERAWENYEDGASSNSGDGDNKCVVSYPTEDGNTYYSAAKSATAGHDYIYIYKNNTDYADGDCVVFETKLRINHNTSSEFIVQLKLGNWNGTQVLYFGNSNANDRTAIRVSNGTIASTYPGIYTNEWFDVRVECYIDESNNIISSNAYINGAYIGTNTTVATLSTALTQATVYSNINVSGGVDLDNTYFGEGRALTFDGIVNDFENSTVASSGGKISSSNANVIIKNAGSSVEIAEEDGNKYLAYHMSESGAWMEQVVVSHTVPAAEGADMYVFEADVRVNNNVLFNMFGTDADGDAGKATQIYFWKESNGMMRVMYGVGNTAVYTTVKAGDWFRVRVECEGNATRVYVNGDLITEGTQTQDSSAVTTMKIYTLSGAKGDTLGFDNFKAGFVKK